MSLLKSIIPQIHKEGYYFICIFAVVTLILSLFSKNLGVIGTILTIWCIYFFRDPERVTPIGENFVISPADGLIQKIEMAMP
ncbi:MAG: phosphatidylserine decarboxylase, partial [Methanobacterium sp.]